MSEDTNQEILAELRKLKRIFYAMLIFFILAGITPFIAGSPRDSSVSWDRVRAAMERQNFSAALAIAQALVRQQPDYSYGHAWLGAIYLAMDDVTNSEAEYSRAYQLFPDEEYEKDLAAVRKRLTAKPMLPTVPGPTLTIP